MFKSITWGLYLQGLLIAVPTYYLVILVLYYRNNIRRWLGHTMPALMTRTVSISGNLNGISNETNIETNHEESKEGGVEASQNNSQVSKGSDMDFVNFP